MCIGGLTSSPSIPKTPERQSVKQPSEPARDVNAQDEARRRGMMATILTSSAGALSPLTTTASGSKATLG